MKLRRLGPPSSNVVGESDWKSGSKTGKAWTDRKRKPGIKDVLDADEKVARMRDYTADGEKVDKETAAMVVYLTKKAASEALPDVQLSDPRKRYGKK